MASPTLSSVLAKPKAVAARDTAIDFTKGSLVLFMVLYHWLNYFIASQGQFYNYLRFLTPSFIFITGFMISQIHIQKYGTESLRLPGRLLTRGFKLVAVFVGMNVLINLSPLGSSARRAFIGNSLPHTIFSIFVTGNISAYDGQKPASFGILLVIAYLLLLSAGLTLLSRRVRHAFQYAFLLFILGIFLLRLGGTESVNLDLLMTGILGVVFGYARREQIAAVTMHPPLLCAIYSVYLAAITLWNVTFPIQVIGVILTTILIYTVGQSTGGPRTLRGSAILLGKYSLFGYIAQIGILQALRRWPWFSQPGVVVLMLSLFLALTLTVVMVDILDWARVKSKTVNRLYVLVFA